MLVFRISSTSKNRRCSNKLHLYSIWIFKKEKVKMYTSLKALFKISQYFPLSKLILYIHVLSKIAHCIECFVLFTVCLIYTSAIDNKTYIERFFYVKPPLPQKTILRNVATCKKKGFLSFFPVQSDQIFERNCF